MKTNIVKTITKNNLIGNSEHREFLQIQSAFGISQRGGSQLLFNSKPHYKRLVSNVNFLESNELKKLVFNEIIFAN